MVRVGKILIIALLTSNAFIGVSCATSLSSLTTKVRTLLYETSSTNSLYADAQIYDAINQAQKFLLDIMPISAHYNMLTEATSSVTVGNNSATLPTDFRRIVQVKYNGKPAIQVNPETYYSTIGKATITTDPMFFIRGTKIYLFPTVASGTKEATLLYQKMPTELTASTHEISLLVDYDYLLVLSATQIILQNDNQVGRAAAIEKSLSNVLSPINNRFANTNVIEKVGTK